jgi:undecaprenyl-diphosphatase
MYASSNMLFWCPLYAAVLYCIIRVFKNNTNSLENTVLNVAMIISLVVICTVVFPPFFDTIIPRLKPCHNPDIYRSVRLLGNDCGDYFGFFANRACFAFALCTYIFISLPRNFNWLKFTLVFWAILISYSRIYVGVHYPLNVLTASMIGVMNGIFIHRVYNYFKNSLFLI